MQEVRLQTALPVSEQRGALKVIDIKEDVDTTRGVYAQPLTHSLR